MSPSTWFRTLHPDWRAALVGAAAAPTLTLVGLVVGVIEGGLLPGVCQGLACLYTAMVLLYSAGILVAWSVIAIVTAATRRRWEGSTVRTRILQLLAGISYVPALWVVLTVTGDGR